MDEHTSEKILAICYPLIIGLSFIASVTSAIAFHHWKYVLDYCVESNCGCFLYGSSTRVYYLGGHVAYCHFVSYGLVIPIIFGIVFACYHVYRVCISYRKRKSSTTTVHRRSDDIVIVTAHTELSDNEIPSSYWITTAIISCFMSVYSLVYTSIYTDGFNQSCREYRNELVKLMIASGNTVTAIRGRISCAAVLDFMDYLHLDISVHRRRDYRINTASCLYIALISGWLLVFLWIAVTYINIISARRSKMVSNV